MSKERTLDIGIGKGGKYIHSNNSMRVGMDISFDTLSLFPNSNRVSLCQADAEQLLPFEQISFDHVDIILPHDELLYELIQPESSLWQELYRVTKSETLITIIVDVPMMGNQGIYVHDEPMIISMPQIKIVDCAINSGFKIFDMKNMTPTDVGRIGSEFSKWMASDMQSMYTHVYKIMVSK